MASTVIYTDRDTVVLSDYPDNNYDGNSYDSFYTDEWGTACVIHGFNIASAPASANVSSVILSLKSNGYGANNIDVKRITYDNWSETTLTWNLATYTSTNALTGLNWVASQSWTAYDITAIYKDAKDAGMNILGTRLNNPSDSLNVVYMLEAGSGYIAYITITYTTAKPIKINIGDSWKDVSAMKINIGDAWKDVVSVKQNIGDAWKTVF